MRELTIAPLPPSEPVFVRVIARPSKLDYASLPEPTKSRLVSARAAILDPEEDFSQNVDAHPLSSHAELLTLLKSFEG